MLGPKHITLYQLIIIITLKPTLLPIFGITFLWWGGVGWGSKNVIINGQPLILRNVLVFNCFISDDAESSLKNCVPTVLYFTFYILHFTFYILHFTFYILHFTFYILHFTFYILYFTFYILHFIFYILHFTFYILHFTFYILHFTFYILYFTFYILHFTFYILPPANLNYSEWNPWYTW